MFRTNIVEQITKYFVFSNIFFENRAVYEIKWKIIQSETGHNDNMAHAQCMLDT